jgi:hypothetical protein
MFSADSSFRSFLPASKMLGISPFADSLCFSSLNYSIIIAHLDENNFVEWKNIAQAL